MRPRPGRSGARPPTGGGRSDRWLVQRQAIEEKLADPGLYLSLARDSLQSLLAERTRIEAAIAETEHRWLVAAEALEAATDE